MNFLSPWFLLGAVAIGGPILFHLIRRAAQQRITFSSLIFLRPTPPRLTQRRRIEHFWLLLLRCLCLMLLAAAFARPFIAKDIALPTPAAPDRQVIVLIDTSASMKRNGLWDNARSIANQYLKKSSPGDQIAVMAFDRQPRALLSFAEWSACPAEDRVALAQARLATVSPSWMNTQLGPALTTAAATFPDEQSPSARDIQREIVLVTDLQEGAKLDGLQGHEWPAGVKVVIERVEATAQANAGIEVLNESTALTEGSRPTRVRIANARDANREKYQIAWATGTTVVGQPTEIYLAPGQTRAFAAPAIPTGATPDRLLLMGDDVVFDNQTFYAAAQTEQVKIAWLGAESTNDPQRLRYYIDRVFPKTPRREIEISSPGQVSIDSLSTSAFAVIPGSLAADQAAKVREWLGRGKTALLVLTNAQMESTLSALIGQASGTITEAEGDFALLSQIDFTHPLFAVFADPRFSDFSHIHFWKHRRFEMPAIEQSRVLARFDDGSPALAQIPVGKGALLVLASGWNPADSQLAVSSKFPPLMNMLLDWSGSSALTRLQFSTGDAIPAPSGNGEVRWRKPDGKVTTAAANIAFLDTDQPGIYTATVDAKERRFAVNLPLDESRTAPMSPDVLARLQVPLQTPKLTPPVTSMEHLRHLRETEVENHQKLWRWVIISALAVTLVEIALSGWLARRAKKVEVAL